MDFLTEKIKKLYWKYLAASVASAAVISVYSFIDMIAIGQSEGPVGSAAMAVLTPLFGICIFFAILCGVGGSVLMGKAKGEANEEKGNAYFTAALILMGSIIAVLWLVLIFFHKPIFIAFGADEEVLPKALEYGQLIVWAAPLFMIPSFIGAFIRNDGNPTLVMVAVIIGGCVNTFGDWFFVFPLGMKMRGAATATVIGSAVQAIIMCSHFFLKKCHLRLAKPHNMGIALRKILVVGFGSSILELGNIVLTVMMNNQIMRYGDANALAVFGLIVSVATLFQCLYSGVGQAVQPIASANFGAGQYERIKTTWRMSFITVIGMGIAFTGICEALPTQITRLFMDVTPEVLVAAPSVIRPYSLMFLFFGITVLATYYLQATMHSRISITVSLLRSMFLSGAMVYLLPLFLDIFGVWLALPISELIVAVFAIIYVIKVNRTLVEQS